MLPTTINRALSIGQKALQPITENYKNETLWLLQKCLNISSDKLESINHNGYLLDRDKKGLSTWVAH